MEPREDKMPRKNHKIQIHVGTTELILDKLNDFENQIVKIFYAIADFEVSPGVKNGGNYRKISGRFEGRNDSSAYEMNFYCMSKNLPELLDHIKDTFQTIKPNGVRYVSVKEFKCESHSFEIGGENA